MGYSDVDDDVKPILVIAPDETTYDTELAACVVTGDAIIDRLLRREGLSVPSSVPQNVKDASANFAAWDFRRKRDPGSAEGFWVAANRFLQMYIDSEAESGFRVGQA